jgi:aspartate/methionine/tyrosine aminotransferase
MRPSTRSDIAPFYVMEVMKAAAERERVGGDVLHMEVGQPSTGAPEGVLAAAEKALRSDRLGYTGATGLPELKDRIARYYEEVHGLTLDAGRIVITVGASAGCVLSFLAAFDAGDRVAVSEPGYPCYRNMLEAFGVEVVGIPVGPDTRYSLTPQLLAAAGDIAGVVVASPANPTGTAFTDQDLAAITAFCHDNDVRLISDEIYHGIDYGRRPPTAAAHLDSAVVLQSFSKYYSMTGWRLGWLIAPGELVPPIERLAQNLFISAPTLSQLAAMSAFDCSTELDENVARYRTNREIVRNALISAGFTDLAPSDGAFYVYANVEHLTDDSQALCARWLEETGVAVTPGVDFDPARGHHYVRFSYSESTADVTEAMARIVEWCGNSSNHSER